MVTVKFMTKNECLIYGRRTTLQEHTNINSFLEIIKRMQNNNSDF